jgi:fructose-1,6-bisphosphatase I
MMVYSAGAGVYGFTLDPGVGEFVLTHPNLKFPPPNKSKNNFSVNMGNYPYWEATTKKYVDSIIRTEKSQKLYTYRYTGTLVADFHRNLIHGGLFLYPADYKKDPNKLTAKLTLLIEAAPIAFIAEQAGGKATTGTENILDIVPASLQHTIPLIVGTKYDVEQYEAFVRENGLLFDSSYSLYSKNL